MRTIVIFVTVFLLDAFYAFDPKDHVNWDLLRHDICGTTNSDRIIGGSEAPLGAYPWLARIGYGQSITDVSFQCGGSIISEYVILTAGHCVSNQRVMVIRLGEYNSDTDPDCENGFCADPVVNITPTQLVLTNNYNTPAFHDDIALIRLSEKINFTAFVKPICLPSGILMQKDFAGSKGEVAGWGIFDVDSKNVSSKLLVVKLPIITNEDCETRIPKFLKLTNSQLCAGGEINLDSCNGDSGGPLMKVDAANGEPRYYILGIVSFGAKVCGKTTMPGVYTKVAHYLKWILDNLNSTTESAVNIAL